jgi:hypothetical protein
MKNKADSFIRSASLGFLETFDPIGHEWNHNPGKAFAMSKADAETRKGVLVNAGFSDVEIVPVDSVPAVPNIETLNIAGLARVIRANWPNVYFGAKPYLSAMSSMDSVKDNFGADPGTEIVLYFLSNAMTWKGRVAQAVKAELKSRLKKAGCRIS